MRVGLWVLALAVSGGCRREASREPDTSAPDTALRDTALHDTADSAPPDTVDTAPRDTAPATPAPTGRVDVRGWSAGVTHAWACEDTGLSGGWVDALGNVAGSVSCASGDGHSLVLTFTRGSAGAWTDPSGGVDFTWELADGTRVFHAASGLTPTRWSVAFTRWERLTLDTVALDATLAARWTDAAGVEVAALEATFAVVLPG